MIRRSGSHTFINFSKSLFAVLIGVETATYNFTNFYKLTVNVFALMILLLRTCTCKRAMCHLRFRDFNVDFALNYSEPSFTLFTAITV